MAVTRPKDPEVSAVAADPAGDPIRPAAEGTPLRDRAPSLQDHARSRRDHAAINRLADELLPALISRLSSSGLGEIEVREGGWKARLSKPVADRRVQPVRPEEHRTHAPAPRQSAPHRDEHEELPAEPPSDEDLGVVTARSPAVGIYTPRRDLVVGLPVRSGDRIGMVDVLGIHQEVLSPIDGVIGSSLAEAGEAVEFGQELVRIETADRSVAGDRPAPGQKATASMTGRS
jgi:biotin carboxyl carrier protein